LPVVYCKKKLGHIELKSRAWASVQEKICKHLWCAACYFL